MKFKEGKILETFCVEKNGKKIEVTIRYPKKSDLRQIWKFYNKVIKETEFLPRITPVSLSDERKWLAGVLDGMRKNDKILLSIRQQLGMDLLLNSLIAIFESFNFSLNGLK